MAGRKPVVTQLTAEQIEELAAVGCTDNEIAAVARVSERTLQRHFDTQLKSGRANLRANLRTAQVRRALDGDNTMLIWLGKQYLGQRDQLQQTGELHHVHASLETWKKDAVTRLHSARAVLRDDEEGDDL